MRRLVFLIIGVLSFSLAAETILLDRTTVVNYAPRIGLALGGGSARGLTHIGVLSVFEDEGIPVAAISGTSMGAIVGSFYALGYSSAEIATRFQQFNMSQVFTMTQFPRRTYIGRTPLHTFFEEDSVGVFHSYPVEAFLQQQLLLKDYQYHFDFDQYPTKLRIVATDFLSGEKTVFTHGPAYQAVCASMSLPFVFKPYEWQGKYYVDGALAENVPVSPLLGVSLDYRIAIDVSQPETGDERIYRFDSYAWQLSALMVQRISEQSLAHADLVIHIPPSLGLSKDNYDHLPEFMALGRTSMQQSLAQVRTLVADYDAQATHVTIRELRNETAVTLQIPLQTPLAKTTLLRSIYKQVRPVAVRVRFTPQADGTYALTVFPAAYKTQLTVPRINALKIIGNTRISTEVIRDMIKLNTPTPYNQKYIDHISRYLYSTGLFSSVHISLENDETDGVILVVSVKESRKGLVYLDGAYYSAEGQPEIALGFYDSYRLGRNRFQMQLRTGAYAGGMSTFEMYDLVGNNLGFGVAYDRANRDIRLYQDFKPTERVFWTQESKDIYVNYTSYDYFYATVGVRAYTQQSPGALNQLTVPRLHLEYNGHDQTYVPREGIRFAGDYESGQLNRNKVSSWAAVKLNPDYSVWLLAEQAHTTSKQYPYWYSPERGVLPFGFMPMEGLVATYTYSRLSLVRSLFLGLSAELAVDTYDGNGQTSGIGSFVHYPMDIGCVSVGYGTNSYNGVFTFNFAKQM